jgi:ABC-type siderophore export system fused ATPase/permease subunit
MVGSTSGVSTLAQPLAIVLMVLILGSSAYLWRQGYLRGRAALITLVGVVIILIYFGFFARETAAVY